MVNERRLQANWNELKGKLKKKWGQLTNEDLQTFDGNVDRLIGVIQSKTGEARSSIERHLEEFTSSDANGISQAAETVRDYAGRAAEAMERGSQQAMEAVRQGYRGAEAVKQASQLAMEVDDEGDATADSEGTTPVSLKDHLASLATQFLQADTILRVGTVWFVVWVWLTLVGLTMALTKEINDGRDLMGLGSLIAAFPAALVWLRLMALTKLNVTILQSVLRGFANERLPESKVGMMKKLGAPLADMLEITGKWATAFIFAWVIILIAKAAAGLISGGFLILQLRGLEWFR